LKKNQRTKSASQFLSLGPKNATPKYKSLYSAAYIFSELNIHNCCDCLSVIWH